MFRRRRIRCQEFECGFRNVECEMCTKNSNYKTLKAGFVIPNAKHETRIPEPLNLEPWNLLHCVLKVGPKNVNILEILIIVIFSERHPDMGAESKNEQFRDEKKKQSGQPISISGIFLDSGDARRCRIDRFHLSGHIPLPGVYGHRLQQLLCHLPVD